MKIYMYYVIYEHEEKYINYENRYTWQYECILWYMYMEIYVYYVTYLHGLYTHHTHHVIYLHEYMDVLCMLYIHTKIYMKLYMHYVICQHEDIHVLCKIFAWRDTCIMHYICMRLYMYHVYYILYAMYKIWYTIYFNSIWYIIHNI